MCVSYIGRFPHFHTPPYLKKIGVDTLAKFIGNFSKIRFFRYNRIPGQFSMCENLPWHRFQFNSQISIYFDIKQWFLINIRKMNIVLSIYIQTVKKKHQRKRRRDLMRCEIIKLQS